MTAAVTASQAWQRGCERDAAPRHQRTRTNGGGRAGFGADRQRLSLPSCCVVLRCRCRQLPWLVPQRKVAGRWKAAGRSITVLMGPVLAVTGCGNMQDQQQRYEELRSKAWKPRRWRGHFLQCCGPECSPEDVAGCCIGCYLPCIAYSWNVSKVLHAPFWRSLLVYVCLLWLVSWLANGLNIGKAAACFLRADPAPSGDGNAEAMDAAACSTLTTLAYLAGLASFVCLVCWAVFVGGARRRRMREELGIAVTDEGRCCSPCHNNSEYFNDDCCLHYWCLSCALAQETRTILHQEATGQMPPRLVNGGYRPGLTGEDEEEPLNPATTAPAAPAGGMQRGPAAANDLLPV